MIYRDASALAEHQVEVDVAIAGAGAAGIALAREFAGLPIRVALLEGGDFSHRHRSQLLYRGENIGRKNISTAFSRFRRFGGSTVRWGGQCRPLDPIDFASGWPFDYEHMQPYYQRAQRVCNLGPYDYEPTNWQHIGGGPLPIASDLLQTRVYQFSYPTDFGLAYRQELASASNIAVYLNANLLQIHTGDNARRVEAFRTSSFARQALQVRAKHYVLACGGIENARLLLASDGARRNGLGNEHGLVGRYFMDHPYMFPGYFVPSRPQYDRSFYVIEGYEGTGSEQKMHAAFTLSDRVRREEGLNGCAIYLLRRPRYKTGAAYFSPGGRGLTHLIEILQHRELPDGRLLRSLRQMAGDFGNVCRTLSSRIQGLRSKDNILALRAALETTPCRDSRVVLGARKDRFGMPRVQVDWRINDSDQRGYERLMQVLRGELSRCDLGHLIEHGQYEPDGWPSTMIGGKHHMCTTRMAMNAKDGVVDPNCQVHGMDNLHIAGSSVFATGGYANPTLTIVALAVRLADRLKGLL